MGYHPPVHYLIDGYNLAHWLAGDDDLEAEALRALLLGHLSFRRPRDAETITIYWDSRTAGQRAPHNECVSGCEERFVPSADDAIGDGVADSPRPRGLRVVSRDREGAGRSRQLGAKVTGPAELLGGRGRRGR